MLNDKEDKKVILPSFVDMINYVMSEVNTRMQKPAKCYSQGNHVLPFPVPVYKEIMTYLRSCLVQNLNVALSRDIIRHPTEVTPLLCKHIQEIYAENEKSDKNILLQYLQFNKKLLRVNSGEFYKTIINFFIISLKIIFK